LGFYGLKNLSCFCLTTNKDTLLILFIFDSSCTFYVSERLLFDVVFYLNYFMKSNFKKILFQLCVFIVCANYAQSQCAQFTGPNLGNDTILCPGNTLQFDLSGLQNNPTITWDNGTNTAIRTVSSSGTYFVETKYLSNSVVLNGDFTQGNTGFSTAYIVGTGGAFGQLSNQGTYAVNTSPSNVHNNFSFCGDHTTGTGNMMIVNGANIPGTSVWCQTVNVSPNTDYEFSTWVANALNDLNVAQLRFTINGINIGVPFSAGVTGCTWNQFFAVWNSGTSTTANICITNLNNTGGGNDFALDDISFAPICIFNDTIDVSYNASPVFTLPTILDECSGSTLTLDAENPGFDFDWITGETTQTIQVDTSGTFTVSVSDSGYCEDEQDFIVTFHEPPNAGMDDSFSFCDTDLNVDLFSLLDPSISTSGAWYTELGILINGGQLDISQLSGINNYEYVLTSTFCPLDTAVFELDIKVFKSAGNDISERFCSDGTTNLNNFLTVNNAGVWSSLDGLSNSIFNPSSGILQLDNLSKNSYNFQFVVSNDFPCEADTAFVSIELSEIADIQFSANLYEGCSPLTVDFMDLTVVNGSTDYTWFVDGNQVGVNNTMSYTFEEVKCYNIGLRIVTDNFCTSSLTENKLICINLDPVAAFDFKPKSIFSDNPVVNFENQSELNAQNQWNFAGLGQSTEAHPIFTFPFGKESNYEVKLIVTSDKGCIDSTTRIVPVKDQTIFYVPNAFTPNGDDNNNVFLPIMTVGVDPQQYKFEVYNRWGEKIFESNDYSVGWDGTYGSQIVKAGMYSWKITFNELKNENVVIKTGTVVLIR